MTVPLTLPIDTGRRSALEEFPWLKKIPEWQPLLDKHTKPETVDALVQRLYDDGAIQDIAEAVMAKRWAMGNLVYFGMSDLAAEMVRRYQNAGGLIDWKQVADVKNLADALLKMSKALIEIEAEGVLSRRAKLELGSTRGDPVQRALDDWANKELPQNERMSHFLGGGRGDDGGVSDAQYEMVEEPDQNQLTPEEWQRINGEQIAAPVVTESE